MVILMIVPTILKISLQVLLTGIKVCRLTIQGHHIPKGCNKIESLIRLDKSIHTLMTELECRCSSNSPINLLDHISHTNQQNLLDQDNQKEMMMKMKKIINL